MSVYPCKVCRTMTRYRGFGRLAVEIALIIAAVVAVAVWRDDSFDVTAPAPPTPALDALEVRLPEARGKYSREAFGQRWSDDVEVGLGHNGCDTRNDILARDLTDVEFKPRTRDCVVLSGTLEDPFSGELIFFRRGQDTSALVHIDHVVALSDAWSTGAQAWSPQRRRDFANDPRNLLAVSGELNQEKSGSNAARWMPPNAAFRCDYAARIVEVKAAYGLWVTRPERDALARELARC